MSFEQYFPQGIATGSSFLGRDKETQKLIDNINSGRHTLLIAPRRYGKTSLIKHAIGLANIAFTEIDLFLAIDDKAIENRFLSGIENLIQVFSDKPEQWMMTLVDYFRKARKKWTVGFKGVTLEIKPEAHDDIAANLLDAFNALEHILSIKEQRAVIFIDEFQEIGKVGAGSAIEGAIRHFAQTSKYLVFIFSGSNRRILEDIFGSRTRPLYSLCQWITLQRLSSEIYLAYLRTIAKQTWDKVPDDNVLLQILELTERHPEATYGFCGYLWQYCAFEKKVLSIDAIQCAWDGYVAELVKRTKLALSELSPGQLKVLILLATGYKNALTGKDAQGRLGLTSPTIVYALNVLSAQDLIERMPEKDYRVIDPVIKATLVNYYTDYL